MYIVRDSRPRSPGEEYSSESQIEDEISIKFRIFDARRVRRIFRGGKGRLVSLRGDDHIRRQTVSFSYKAEIRGT